MTAPAEAWSGLMAAATDAQLIELHDATPPHANMAVSNELESRGYEWLFESQAWSRPAVPEAVPGHTWGEAMGQAARINEDARRKVAPNPAPGPTWKTTQPPRVKCRWRDGTGESVGTAAPFGPTWLLTWDSGDSVHFPCLPAGWEWSPMPAGTEPPWQSDEPKEPWRTFQVRTMDGSGLVITGTVQRRGEEWCVDWGDGKGRGTVGDKWPKGWQCRPGSGLLDERRLATTRELADLRLDQFNRWADLATDIAGPIESPATDSHLRAAIRVEVAGIKAHLAASKQRDEDWCTWAEKHEPWGDEMMAPDLRIRLGAMLQSRAQFRTRLVAWRKRVADEQGSDLGKYGRNLIGDAALWSDHRDTVKHLRERLATSNGFSSELQVALGEKRTFRAALIEDLNEARLREKAALAVIHNLTARAAERASATVEPSDAECAKAMGTAGEPKAGAFCLVQWGKHDAGLAVRRGELWSVLWIDGGHLFPEGGYTSRGEWRAGWRWRTLTIGAPEAAQQRALARFQDWARKAVGDDGSCTDDELRTLLSRWRDETLNDLGKSLSEVSRFRQWARTHSGLPTKATGDELRTALTARFSIRARLVKRLRAVLR